MYIYRVIHAYIGLSRFYRGMKGNIGLCGVRWYFCRVFAPFEGTCIFVVRCLSSSRVFRHAVQRLVDLYIYIYIYAYTGLHMYLCIYIYT